MNKNYIAALLFCLFTTNLCHASGQPENDPLLDQTTIPTVAVPIEDNQAMTWQQVSEQCKTYDDIVRFSKHEGFAKALEECKIAAMDDNADALCLLGACLVQGISCDKDDIMAFNYFQIAAKQGHAAAMENLGACYHQGIGCDANPDLAFKCFKEAADEQNMFAMHDLAYCYRMGVGCLKSDKLAFKWYEKAAILGNEDAMCWLGDFYTVGVGCKINYELAFKWYKEAAEKHHLTAMNELGYCLQKGIGCQKNEALAFEWYEKAAAKNHSNATHNLGYCYHMGVGVQKNDLKAFQCYSRAANMGDKDSITHLGLIYFEGSSAVQKNRVKALELLEQVKEHSTVSDLIARIHFENKDYGLAYENFLDAQAKGIKISSGLMCSLQKKIRKKKFLEVMKNRKIESKPDVGSNKAAIKAQKIKLENAQTETTKFFERLKLDLAGIVQRPEEFSDCDIDAPALLTQIINFKEAVEQYLLNNNNLLDKQKRVDALSNFLDYAEEQIQLAEARRQNKVRVKEMQNQSREMQFSGAHKPEIARREDSLQEARATKEHAKSLLNKEKQKAHKQNTRKHAGGPKKAERPATSAQALPKGPQTIMPYVDTLVGYLTRAMIPPAAEKKVTQILNTIRQTEGDDRAMNDAIGRLNTLQGGYNFKDVTPEYAGVPGADIAFQMYITEQFRVIIAFERVRELVVTANAPNDNNAPAVYREVYKLYGGKIYVADPHKG